MNFRFLHFLERYKWPKRYQWKQFFKILTKKEKIAFSLFLFLFCLSFSFLLVNFYFKNTKIVPAEGGIYIEGLLGSPRWINPLYAPANDVDRDLTELIFSGLMKYDENGKIIPDLAEKYEILENGKIYQFYLKKNLFWSDGHPLTADDILFTIKSIQDQNSKSPLRGSWLGVKVEKISDLGIRFELKNESSVFLENTTLKIIPKHIWGNISPQNFPLAVYNLKPVGSGPYKLKSLNQDSLGNVTSLELIKNPEYFGKAPNIPLIKFKFFNNQEELIEAAKRGEIKGFSSANLTYWPSWTNLYSFSLPRYFAVFFNPAKSKILAEKNIRQALNYGTNKEEIVNKLFEGRAKIVNSPILPEIFGFEEPAKIYQFDLEKAKEILNEAGFLEGSEGRVKIVKKEPAFQLKSDLSFGSQGKEVEELQRCLARDPEVYPEGTISGFFGQKTREAVIKFQEKYKKEILEPWGIEEGTGQVRKTTRDKLNGICFKPLEEIIPLKFSLSTVDQPMLIEVVNLLKEQWEKLGVKLDIQTFDVVTLEKEVIKPRNYEMLLFGEVLGAIPDPYPFWHSSQKKDPGLNLANYGNKESDKLLEKARQTLNEMERKNFLEEFQNLLIEDAPALFLYSPDYLYFVSKEIKGIEAGKIIDSSKRFNNIEKWYIKTKRVW